MELSDWMNSINYTKKNLIDENISAEKEYLPYIINKCLSGSIDCLMYSNEMNMNGHLSKKMQYDFYINSIRKRRRFSPWINKEKIKDLEIIKKYYGYNDEKANQSLKILTKTQIKFIKDSLETGGNNE
jgi:hypothetical protein